MSDNISFALWLKDMTGGTFQAFGRNSSAVFDVLDKRIGGAKKGMGDLGAVEYKLRVDSSDIDRAGRKLDDLNERAGRGFSVGRFAAGDLLARGVETGVRKISELGHEAFNAGADAEQQIIALKTFVGKDKSLDIYKDLQQSSAHTPFTTAEILPGVQQMMASGLGYEKAKKDVWGLMNALSATGNSGNGFALELGESHLAQMAAQGNVDAMFLREFQRTLHVPMTRLLADQMHVPMKQIAEWTESGELKQHVSYDTFADALNRAAGAGGKFAFALEEQSQTIKGKLSTIKDWWNIGMTKLALEPKTHDNIIRIEDRIIKAFEGISDLVGRISPVVNTVFDRLDEMGPSIKDFGMSLLNLVRPFGNLLLSPEFRDAGRDILDFAKEIAQTLTPAVKMLEEGFKGLLSWLPKPKERPLGLGESTPYVWSSGNADSLGKAGFIVDEARKRAVEDSLKGMGAMHFFNNVSDVWRYNQHQAEMGKGESQQLGAPVILAMPYVKGGSGMAGSSGAGAGMGDVNEKIVGGGPRQVIMNFNAPLYKVDRQTFQGIEEQIKDWEPKLREALLRILYSVPAR